MRQPVVGFDLDMTLIDTRAGFAATLDRLGAETGVQFDTAALTARLGPPLDHLLGGHYPPDQIAGHVERFRALYPDHAVRPTPALPGAHAALDVVRRHGGRVVVVTGKYQPNALLHTAHLDFRVDEVVGEVWGVGKAAVLEDHDVDVYVGDHVHDVEGALAAGVVSVSVLTGGCTRAELEAAGSHVVLDDLRAFPGWFSRWAATRQPRRPRRS